MKTTVKIAVFVISIIILVLIFMSLTSEDARANENENALASAVEQSLEQLKSEGYKIENNNELIAEFIQRLLVQINSDSDIKVDVLKADTEKGLLDIKVTQIYNSVKGNKKEVSCRKTVLMEEYTDNHEKEYRTISFYVNGTLHSKYTAYDGSNLVLPVQPEVSGKTFKYWVQEGLSEPADIENIIVTDEISLNFHATFE